MKIGILTYQINHKKTFDTLCYLRAKGYTDVIVFATPLSYEKRFTPLFNHRPSLCKISIVKDFFSTEELCKSFGYFYKKIDNYLDLLESDIEFFLICGAGLLPVDLYKSKILINSHPGYLPFERGLDSFKWAIVDKTPIGVTTHFIGDEVDAGMIIQRIKVPVYKNDTFFELAYRQYEYEVCLLVESLQHINEEHENIVAGDNILHRRMPKEIEMNLPKLFEEYKLFYGEEVAKE